ncbi:MAG: carbon monoxide dehydrogenase subunit G [Candidatus Poriferisodalaceae bacterium]|jgi:carbon monoxide dehydrogenase subunit G
MARYVVHVRSPKPADEAFAYMADLSNFAEWDPGVEHAEQVQGDGPGPNTAFDVTVKGIGGSLTLRYDVTDYDPPEKVVAKAQSRLLTSLDTITVRGDGDGSVVTYDAELKLNGLLGLADPLLGLSFNRIGDRAATGLVRALDGKKVEEPTS